MGIGICMDINPYEYQDESLLEFANYHLKAGTKLILFLANWLGTDPKSTQNYWAYRLRVLIGKNIIFAASNRIGEENGTTVVCT